MFFSVAQGRSFQLYFSYPDTCSYMWSVILQPLNIFVTAWAYENRAYPVRI